MTYCIGLTGGIGSGKSTVAAIFRELGTTVIDTDTISHQLTQSNGAAISHIEAAFGKRYLTADGALDRARMRQLVFSDPNAKERLEKILHPLIRAHLLTQLGAASTPYALLVVPLLLEARNYRDLVQRVLVVDCPEDIQLDRAMRRSALSEPEVKAIMAQQFPRAERLRHASDVIHNENGLDSLRHQVLVLHRDYLDRSSQYPAAGQ